MRKLVERAKGAKLIALAAKQQVEPIVIASVADNMLVVSSIFQCTRLPASSFLMMLREQAKNVPGRKKLGCGTRGISADTAQQTLDS